MAALTNRAASTHARLPDPPGSHALPRAAAIAFAIEALLVIAVAVGLPAVTRHPREQPVMLSLTTMPDTPKTVAPPPPTTKPPTPPTPRAPTPRSHPQRPQVHHAPPKPTAPQAEPAAPMPALAPPVPAPPSPATVPTPPAPPVPVTSNADHSVQLRFEDAVRTAVQSAMRYPYAARIAHMAGRAQVSFNYLDGQISAIQLESSSGYSVLDAAALDAVSHAAYPPPPASRRGTRQAFKVWVRFSLSGEDAD